jgi:hypothetical protein
MNVSGYLAELDKERRRQGVAASRFMEETRGHLADAVEAGQARGLSQEEAEREAIARYGDARTVAAKFASGRNRTLHWVLLAAAIAMGLAIAWVDSRPHWDDTGITAGSLLLSAGLLGMIVPRRPWLWALGIGIWIPAHQFVKQPTLGSVLGGCVILAIPMAGAYAGMAVRRAVTAVAGNQQSA